jgi:hypothetical protein
LVDENNWYMCCTKIFIKMHVLNCYIVVFQACNFWLGSSFQTTILACFAMCLWVSELGVDACTAPLLAWFSHERGTWLV